MPTKEEIEKVLGDTPPVEYPRPLYTARKAEFVTMVRKNQPKKPGCRMFVIILCFVPLIIGAIMQLITTIF